MANVNWPGLLAWSSTHHDGTAPTEFKPMTAEDRAFLEGAMEEAFGKSEDANKIMFEALRKLDDPSIDVVRTALEVIDQCCDYPDCPRNLERLEGVQPMLRLLEHEQPELGCRSAELLAVMFSFNSEVQLAAFKHGGVTALRTFMERDDECRVWGLGALVSLIRGEKEIEESFMASGGDALLAGCMSFPRTSQRAANFARHLIFEGRCSDGSLFFEQIDSLLEDQVGSIQYGEVIAAFCQELVKVSTPDQLKLLKAAVSKRMAALLRGASAADNQVEIDNLSDTLKAIQNA